MLDDFTKCPRCSRSLTRTSDKYIFDGNLYCQHCDELLGAEPIRMATATEKELASLTAYIFLTVIAVIVITALTFWFANFYMERKKMLEKFSLSNVSYYNRILSD